MFKSKWKSVVVFSVLGFFCNPYTCLSSQEKENVQNYLSQELKSVADSIETMNKYGINIIPAPKRMDIKPEKIYINASNAIIVIGSEKKHSIGSDLINLTFQRNNTALIAVKNEKDLSPSDEGKIKIILGEKNINPSVGKFLNSQFPYEAQKSQAYMIKSDEEKKIIILSGYDAIGTLYATVTFSKLLKKDNNGIYVNKSEVTDWPDFKYRGSGSLSYPLRSQFMWKTSKNNDMAKEYIDFLLEHKINLTWSFGGWPGTDIKNYTPAMKHWMKEMNEYALNRGIRIVLSQTWAVGSSAYDKNDPRFKDCIEHTKEYYCWSNEELLKEKCNMLSTFLKETGFQAVFFHCLETNTERWDDRCMSCRMRFGNNRDDADANVVNHLYQACKTYSPDMLMMFVFRPYSHDWETKEGGKEFIEKLTQKIPSDINICRRETSKDDIIAWKKVVKQPIFINPYHRYGFGTATGRMSVTNFRYFRGYYITEKQGDILHFETGWPDNDVAVVGASEYMWNANSPGAEDFPSFENGYEFGLDYKKTALIPSAETKKEIIDLLNRICKDIYGNDAGTYFYTGICNEVDGGFINNTKAFVKKLETYKMLPSDEKLSILMEKQYIRAEAAYKALDELYSKIKNTVIP